MTFSTEDIRTAIFEFVDTNELTVNEFFLEWLRGAGVLVSGLPPMTWVDSSSGADSYMVFRVGDRFFKIFNTYSSWDGITWDIEGLTEVYETTKLVRHWEPV